MGEQEVHILTGAFGYSGKYIARRLLQAGHIVRTLTNSPDRPNEFEGAVQALPLAFDDHKQLVESLKGCKVLYNTYWVRFNHKTFKHSIAVNNTLALFDAAKAAGVERVVHTSITNPSEDSPLEYFSGKAILEQALCDSGLSYAILRPAVLFGPEDILINNMAWTLRKFPFAGVFGDGKYRLQPIYVDDFAALAVAEGCSTKDHIVDAVGPETYTYRDLFKTLGECIGKRRRVIGIPAWFGFVVGWVIGKIVNDKMVTWEEVKGLMSDLLCTDSPPTGDTKLSEWAKENASTLGVRYANELARRRDRAAAYA